MPTWQENITAVEGWIAVVIVIFAAWNPYKAVFGANLFGGLDIIGFRIKSTLVSPYILGMLPYIVTIVVLVFVSSN